MIQDLCLGILGPDPGARFSSRSVHTGRCPGPMNSRLSARKRGVGGREKKLSEVAEAPPKSFIKTHPAQKRCKIAKMAKDTPRNCAYPTLGNNVGEQGGPKRSRWPPLVAGTARGPVQLWHCSPLVLPPDVQTQGALARRTKCRKALGAQGFVPVPLRHFLENLRIRCSEFPAASCSPEGQA